jgi:copper chaperone CopZ
MTRTFSVPGISCGHCKAAIEGELGTTPGVTHAEVDIDAKTVTVDGPATDEQIRAAIDEAGYDVAAVVDAAR